MRASGQQPAARRAESSASKPSPTFRRVKPRRALGPVNDTNAAEAAIRKVGKASVSMVAGAALVGGMTFAAAEPAAAGQACKPSGSAKKITAGDRGKQIRAAECLLERAGFESARVNGKYTGTDRKATRGFQQSRGLKVTGNVNKRTWVALISQGSTPKLSKGDSGSSVVRLQLALSAAGKNVPDTGYYGDQTAARVRSIQNKYDWKATGVAGDGIWNYLQRGGTWSKPTPPEKDDPPASSDKGEAALAYAKKQLGDGYAYGADGPNAFDCSGLTLASYRSVGVNLPRTSSAQYNAGKHVDRSDLQKGDLVFFYSGRSHVAIYAGKGKVIHAPNSSSSVEYTKMSYMPYNGAVRPA
jgi:cell wall-associated NlpC family hydrolase